MASPVIDHATSSANPPKIKSSSIRNYATQLLNLLMIVASAMAIWKGLSLLTNSESPIVVVLSESMEPAFQRGDILFLALPEEPVSIGDICVFKIYGKEVPIVHRVIELHTDNNGEQKILTKGDNNPVDDRGLYNQGQLWIGRHNVVGKVRGFLPYIGMLTIILNDYPQAKILLLVVLGALVVFSKDE